MSNPITLTVVSDGVKGRSFTGVLLAMAESSHLWEQGGKGDAIRPIMMVFAASEQEARPLVSNLRLGSKCVVDGLAGPTSTAYLELIKSGGFEWSPAQPIAEEAAVVFHVYQPQVMKFIPAVTEVDKVAFAVMPAHEDIEAVLGLYSTDIDDAISHVQALGYKPKDLAGVGFNRTFIGLSAIWASYLERRTIWAVPQKLAFRSQLLLACLKHGICSLGDPYRGAYTSKNERPWWCAGVVGYRPTVVEGFPMHRGVATRVKGESLADVLAEEVRRFDMMRRASVKLAKKAA